MVKVNKDITISLWKAIEVATLVIGAAVGLTTMRDAVSTNTAMLREFKETIELQDNRIGALESWKIDRESYERGLRDGQNGTQ